VRPIVQLARQYSEGAGPSSMKSFKNLSYVLT